jgi:hypothetical protein
MKRETLLAHKAAFADGLLAAEPDAAPAFLDERYRHRFRVYRNNLYHGLGETLGEAYPVVRRLVGIEFFMATARAYISAHPLREATLAFYGAGFADFLDGFPPARIVPYLADVARLERARLEASHAADAAPLSPEAMMLSEEELASTRLLCHPAMRVVASHYPIASLWQLNQAMEAPPQQVEAIGETVLITRPALALQMRVLTTAQAAFLNALTAGKTITESWACAFVVESSFDVTTAMRVILVAGAFRSYVVADRIARTKEGLD